MPREPNNVLGEWFGHRVYPTVTHGPDALGDQNARRCPFLTNALGQATGCVKAPKSAGVCTISSTSNGKRQDWLVCPYRALDPAIVEDATRRLFGITRGRRVAMAPATTLKRADIRADLLSAMARGDAAFVYMQDKLGGEVSVRATERSPELSFDMTLVELIPGSPTPGVGRYGVLEVQTMDFHGSYSAAVTNLVNALKLHPETFHAMVKQNVGWISEKIEGPNIANVFKRTLYQMLLKFRLAGHGGCAGAALAIPASVWDSWQRHLGGPTLTNAPDGTLRLGTLTSDPRAWIYVFDVDAGSDKTPNPIVLSKVIGTDADAVARYAFTVVPEAIVAEGGAGGLVLDAIRVRLAAWWPEIGR
jgi:hypothetical protein